MANHKATSGDLTPAQLATELNVTVDKAREIIKTGAVKSYQLGPRTVRVPREELDRLRGGR